MNLVISRLRKTKTQGGASGEGLEGDRAPQEETFQVRPTYRLRLAGAAGGMRMHFEG